MDNKTQPSSLDSRVKWRIWNYFLLWDTWLHGPLQRDHQEERDNQLRLLRPSAGSQVTFTDRLLRNLILWISLYLLRFFINPKNVKGLKFNAYIRYILTSRRYWLSQLKMWSLWRYELKSRKYLTTETPTFNKLTRSSPDLWPNLFKKPKNFNDMKFIEEFRNYEERYRNYTCKLTSSSLHFIIIQGCWLVLNLTLGGTKL